jgi:hypothetical protein
VVASDCGRDQIPDWRIQWSHILHGGNILKTACKPKFAYSQNYPRKSFKSPIKYMLLYTPCNIYVYNNVTCRGCVWLIDGLWIGRLDLLAPYSHNSGLQAIQLYRCFHALKFTVTHTLGFSVFTSRILATDLLQSHCHFKSHMNSSLHSLIQFLSFLLNHLRLPSPKLNPILDNSLKRPSLSLYNSPPCSDQAENTAFLLLRRLVYWSIA